MLEIMIRRTKKIGCKVVVATSEHQNDDRIVKIAENENVGVFRGSLLNKINRWYRCFEEHKIDYAMLVDGDDPSFSFSLAKRALLQLKKTNSELIVGHNELMPGLITYGLSRSGINKLHTIVRNPQTNTDVIDTFVKQANLITTVIEPKIEEKLKPGIRLTVDYEEDVIFYKILFKEISYLSESTEQIKKVLSQKISDINWFRDSDFKTNQSNFNLQVHKANNRKKI